MARAKRKAKARSKPARSVKKPSRLSTVAVELVDSDECEWVKNDITWTCQQKSGKTCTSGRCRGIGVTYTAPDGTKKTRISCECA